MTRYQDIMAVDLNHAAFSSSWELGGTGIIDRPRETRLPNFISMDPPRHDEQRKGARLRARVVPQGPPAQAHVATGVAAPAECEQAEPVRARAQHIGWARLLKRVFDIDLRRCPICGAGELKIIAAILQRAAIGKILTHLGLDPRPRPRGRASEAGHAFAAD